MLQGVYSTGIASMLGGCLQGHSLIRRRFMKRLVLGPSQKNNSTEIQICSSLAPQVFSGLTASCFSGQGAALDVAVAATRRMSQALELVMQHGLCSTCSTLPCCVRISPWPCPYGVPTYSNVAGFWIQIVMALRALVLKQPGLRAFAGPMGL